MNIVRQRTGTDFAYKQNLYGSGIGIAVLDSGIYPHPDFMNHGSRITAFRDFVNHRQTPYDDNGHGTHIAGIIAGSGYLSEGKYMGMAPRAHLIILKILDSKGNGTAETVCRAIEWTVRNRSRFHIHILNISIGAKEISLARRFVNGISDISDLKLYGDIDAPLRTPIISLNIGNMSSASVSDILWEDYEICVRAGAHCAPLMHKTFGTEKQGAVRFSFSCFNTEAEIDTAIQAMHEIAE